MGIWDTFAELVEAATPWSVAEAEAPAQEEEPQVRAAPAYTFYEQLGGQYPTASVCSCSAAGMTASRSRLYLPMPLQRWSAIGDVG